MENLTDKTYWEGTYSHRKGLSSLGVDGFMNYSNRLILNKLSSIGLNNKKVLEVGAGDSAWLSYLAANFPSSRFVGIDYTENGCALLAERAQISKAQIEVVQEDMFSANSILHDIFDIVISFGVVEHFEDLEQALRAKSKYVSKDGCLFTLIPNMAGVLGGLARRWNRDVYEKHNPHDWSSFLLGHQKAGLEVLSGGYLGSTGFGVLSSCFPDRQGFWWQISRVLVATSLATWWIESKLGDFPSSKTFSPYIYAISRRIANSA